MLGVGLALAGLLCTSQAQPQPRSAGSAFQQVLDSSDLTGLARWTERYPTLLFRECSRLARSFLGHTGAKRESERAALEFLIRGLEGRTPQALLTLALAYDSEQVLEFLAQEAELARLLVEPGEGLPSASELQSLRSRIEQLGAGALLARQAANLARRLHQELRMAEARAWALWVGGDARRCGDPWMESWSSEFLGRTAWQAGQLEEAARHLARVEELEQSLGDQSYRARLLSDLASIQIGLSNQVRALDYASQSEQIADTLNDSTLRRQALEVRAAALFDLGEHQQALEICLGLTSADGRDAPLDQTQVRIELLAAAILADVGRLESALGFARRALAGAKAPSVAARAPLSSCEARLTLGLLLSDLDQFAEGVVELHRAEQGFSAAGDERGVAWARKNLGWLRLRQQRFEQAAGLLEQARVTGQRLGLPYLEGLSALGVAEALVFGANPAQLPDESRVRSALDVAGRRAEQIQDAQLFWRVDAVQGRWLQLRGDLPGALASYQRSVARIEQWRRRLRTPGLLTHALRSRSDPYRDAAFAAAHLNQPEEALRLTGLLRARALFEQRSGPHTPLSPRGEDPFLPLRRELAQAESRLRDAEHLREPERLGLLDELRAAESRLDAALLRAEVRLTAQATTRRWRLEDTWYDGPARMQQTLEPNQTALSFLLGEHETLVFQLRRTDWKLHRLPVGKSEVTRWVARLLQPLESYCSGAVDLAHLDFDTRAARELYSRLLDPLGLRPGCELLVATDDGLHSLPLELLVAGGVRRPVDPQRPFAQLLGLRFLGDEHVITYLDSLALLAPVRHTDLDQPTALLSPQEAAGLPFARAEADALLRARGRAHVILLEDAAPASLEHVARRAGSLHLIAHGLTDDRFPDQGHLLFREQRLEAWRIESLKLDVGLTVLSACHTAEGAWYPGAGLRGLTRAFLDAGADTVIASRFAVEDQSSAEIMEIFYEQLQLDPSPARALHHARQIFRQRVDPRGFARAHPYFWAGWVAHR